MVKVMQQGNLQSVLDNYEATWLNAPFYADAEITKQRVILARFRHFIATTADPYARSNKIGHITGSAYVVDNSCSKVVLNLHSKLNIWIQLGGHADNGQHDVAEVALREAQEESGLQSLRFFAMHELFDSTAQPVPIDLQVHPIPAMANISEHLHYDINFLLVASKENEQLQISAESHDLCWLSLADASQRGERSVRKVITKLQAIKHLLEQR